MGYQPWNAEGARDRALRKALHRQASNDLQTIRYQCTQPTVLVT
jgi:hypothetical protein